MINILKLTKYIFKNDLNISQRNESYSFFDYYFQNFAKNKVFITIRDISRLKLPNLLVQSFAKIVKTVKIDAVLVKEMVNSAIPYVTMVNHVKINETFNEIKACFFFKINNDIFILILMIVINWAFHFKFSIN